MTAATRWVIGRGLLGRAIERVQRGTVLVHPIAWDDAHASDSAIREGLATLAAVDGPLEIYWTAGRGVTSTPADQLDVEVAVFEAALRAIAEQPASMRSRLGFFLASSVGGAYAGASRPPFTEATVPAPLSAYGDAKLRMETALEAATTTGGWRSFTARITNIYGAGQNLSKAQGLISALVRGHLSGQPISVYVPLDTLRDYIYEDDCAAVIDAGMVRTHLLPAGTTTTKIVGSMRAVSIGALMSELTRLRRRRGSIVLGGGDARGQALDLRVRSTVWTDLDGLVRTSLPEGLSRVYQAQLTGRLDPN
jgi:UDP-glucose 4-epimerase